MAKSKKVVDSPEVVVKNAPEKPLSFYEARRVRHGKTKKDHESGSWKQRFGNRDARVAWQHSTSATNATFPGIGKGK